MARNSVDDPLANGIKHRTQRSINDYLGLPESWPIVEKITHAIVLMPTAGDIRRAKRQDPRACALHNACCRSLDVPNCAIGADYCYIPQKDSKGRPYIARMQASVATKAAILHFDKTGEMPEGGFVFTPVPQSRRLESLRKYERSYGGRRRAETPAEAKARKAKARRQPQRKIPRCFTEEEA